MTQEANTAPAIVQPEVPALAPTIEAGPVDPMISMIQTMALSEAVSIERLQAMIEMKERHEDRQREQQARQDKRAYYAAMAKCQSSIPVVVKKSNNAHNKSTYADLAAIEMQAMPIVHKHGFTISFQPAGKTEKNELRIKWTIAHKQGHIETGVGEIPMDGVGAKGNANMTATQGFGSTASYGRRYLLCMLFNISTGDDDDGQPMKITKQPITEEQYLELRDLIEEAGITEEIVCTAENISNLTGLPSDQIGRVKNQLKITISKRKNLGGEAA